MEGFQVPVIKHMVKTIHKKEYPAISPLNPANSAANKTVLVTGGGTGIGYAIARGFALAGASNIIITGRRSAVLGEAAQRLVKEIPSVRILPHTLDISSSEAVDAAFATVRKILGGELDIDILVLCAAQNAPAGPALSFSPAQIRAFTDTNVLGNINVVRAFLAPTDTKGTKTDKIILDVSSNGGYAVYSTISVYGATKIAFTTFLRHVAAEHQSTGLRVHSFNPGSILTDPARDAGMDENSMPWDDESLPAGFAVWLASPAAKFLSGRFVMSSWDVDELIRMEDLFWADGDLGKVVLKVRPGL